MNQSSFFSGLKVLELSSVLAGPAVGMFFAELGAEVIKIENAQTHGDVTRGWRQEGETIAGASAYYASVNFKKQVFKMDLNKHQDVKRVHAFAAKANLVISNFGAQTAEKLQVSEKMLREENPALIFIQLDGFENSERPAYDVVLQAETGWISMTGADDEQVAKVPVALIDVLAGHQLKEAALLGIIHHMRTGEGASIRCSLERASLASLVNQATNYLMNGTVAGKMGTKHPNIAPYGDAFQSEDGIQFVLAIGSEKHFALLCEALSVPEMMIDQRFAKNQNRLVYRDALAEALQEKFSNHTFLLLQQMLSASGIPFGEIKSLDKVLTSKAAQEMVLIENIDGRNTSRLSGNAFEIKLL